MHPAEPPQINSSITTLQYGSWRVIWNAAMSALQSSVLKKFAHYFLLCAEENSETAVTLKESASEYYR